MKNYLILFSISFIVTMIIGTIAIHFDSSFSLDMIFGLAVGVGVGNCLIEYIKTKIK